MNPLVAASGKINNLEGDMADNLSTRLVNEVQAMFFENAAMRHYLDELRRISDDLRIREPQLPTIPDSRSVIEAIRVSPEMRDLGKDVFLSVRSQLENAPLDQVVEQLLLVIQQWQKVK